MAAETSVAAVDLDDPSLILADHSDVEYAIDSRDSDLAAEQLLGSHRAQTQDRELAKELAQMSEFGLDQERSAPHRKRAHRVLAHLERLVLEKLADCDREQKLLGLLQVAFIDEERKNSTRS